MIHSYVFQNIMGCTYKGLEETKLFFQVVSFISLSLLFSGSQWQKVQDKSALIGMLGVPMLNHAQFHLVKVVQTLARKQRQVLKIKVTFTLNATIIDMFLTLCSQVCHSSRENKGSGGQVTQLQTLECLQMQASHRASKMDIATANEPLNPMAPSIRTLTLHGSRTAGTVVSGFFLVCYLFTNEQPVSEPLLNTGQGPPPTYQAATGGTHFGFQLSAYDKPHPSYTISSVQN